MLRSIRQHAVWIACCTILTMMSTVLVPAAANASSAAPVTRSHALRKHNPADDQGRSKANGHYCDGCTPPLIYSGGQVMDTTGDSGMTITPIYWIPSDWATPFPDDYQTIINQYITDIAADSGTNNNVYSINAEYYQTNSDGTQTNIAYKITAGTPIIDTEPFPANGCELANDQYAGCITDDQIRTELTRVTAAEGVTTNLANIYPIFFPPGMETQDLDGSNSDSAFCGYHRAFGDPGSEIVYGNEPFEASGCDAAQGPNGDVIADGAVGTLSHEINEALTDPTDTTAWNDSSGHEIGDICSGDYGTALGSTDSANPDSTQYNQVINGHFYYTQTEFSNLAYQNYGIGNGCVQSEDAAGGAPATEAGTAVGQVFSYAQPNAIDADGTTTSDISTSVSDHDNNIIEGDSVSFSVYAIAGTGDCGTLSKDAEKTGADGYANITYTASTDDVVCAVVATDSQGGQSSTATLYQGATQAKAPAAADTFPTGIEAGADPAVFTTTFTNGSADDIVEAQVDFSIFPADGATTNVTADQVQLEWSTDSTDGTDGTFTPVALTGSTVEDGGIEGTVGDPGGATIPANSGVTITYRFSIDGAIAPDGDGPLLSFEAYLDQINPASGAGTNLADTGFTDVVVTPSGVAPSDTVSVDTVSADTAAPDDTAGTDTVDTAGTDTVDTSGSDTSATPTDVTTAVDASATTVAPSTSDDSSNAGVIIGVIVAVVVVIGVIVFLVSRKKKQ
ncbi:MAG: hypothetical protein JWN62_911 [Acidimicrobiales bacterium]|nr:hypothetical protein [Acidimicrobiales bacterium]